MQCVIGGKQKQRARARDLPLYLHPQGVPDEGRERQFFLRSRVRAAVQDFQLLRSVPVQVSGISLESRLGRRRAPNGGAGGSLRAAWSDLYGKRPAARE